MISFQLLKRKGYQSLVLQIGRGVSEPEKLQRDDFSMEHYRYKDSIAADIQRASLVISHAGKTNLLLNLSQFEGDCISTLPSNPQLILKSIWLRQSISDASSHPQIGGAGVKCAKT